MKPNCILFYGHQDSPTEKSAGVFRIATELRQHGYIVQCINITAFDDTTYDVFLEILDHLVSKGLLWIGFSISFFAWDIDLINRSYSGSITKYVDAIKKNYPHVQLIAGGEGFWPYFQENGFKLFKGYQDTKIIEYTDWCAKKKSSYEFLMPEIIGSEYKEFNQSQIVFTDSDIISSKEALPIEISRGCIFRCKFCAYPLNGKTKNDHIKSYDILYEEFLRNYEKFGTTKYFFVDDTYNDSLDKIKGLYDNVYSQLPFKIQFTTYLRLDLIMRFPEMISVLKESGLRSAFFGIESINEQSAKAIGKGVNPKKQFEFIKRLKDNEFKNVSLSVGIILGLPYDTIETLEETRDFMLSDENRADKFEINSLGIVPNFPSTWKSEFLLDWKKHGYTYEDADITKPWSTLNNPLWKNTRTGLKEKDALEYKKDIIIKGWEQNKNKISDFKIFPAQTIGISDEDLLNLSAKQIFEKYPVVDMSQVRSKNYINQLMQAIGLSKSIDS